MLAFIDVLNIEIFCSKL